MGCSKMALLWTSKQGHFLHQFFFVNFQVKPRTNNTDPTTGLPYYLGWVFMSSSEENARIVSGYCCCKEGIDGYCRHVAAALFELLIFLTIEDPVQLQLPVHSFSAERKLTNQMTLRIFACLLLTKQSQGQNHQYSSFPNWTERSLWTFWKEPTQML